MRRNLWCVAAALAILGAQAVRADTSAGGSQAPPSVKETIEQVASGKLPLEPLVILYDDLHPFHGGLMLAVHGDGRVEQEAKREKAGKARKLSRADVLKLLALVRKHEAWEQRTPDRAPVPDESRARLTIAWRDRQSVIWEWYNDLAENKRMIEIRELMKQLAWVPGSY
jgi:hypothetical protein